MIRPRLSRVAVASVFIIVVVLKWLAVEAVLVLGCPGPVYMLANMFVPLLHANCNIARMVVLECEDGHDGSEAP